MAKGGYNRYNFLLKVRKVCETYNEHARKGVATGYIYDNYIKNQFFISRATFYNYLSTPYKAEIEKFENKTEFINE